MFSGSFVYHTLLSSVDTLLDSVRVKLEILLFSSFPLHPIVLSLQAEPVSDFQSWPLGQISPLVSFPSCVSFLASVFLEREKASSCFGSQLLCAIRTQAPCVWNVHVQTASRENNQPLSCMWCNTELESILSAAIWNLLLKHTTFFSNISAAYILHAIYMRTNV